jgi:hypothetical protein
LGAQRRHSGTEVNPKRVSRPRLSDMVIGKCCGIALYLITGIYNTDLE